MTGGRQDGTTSRDPDTPTGTPPEAEATLSPVVITPLLGMGEVRAGDDLAELVLAALRDNGITARDGDVLVVSSKVVSKASGLTAPAGRREAAIEAATRRVVAERRSPAGTTQIVESVAGPVMAAAGVDASNTGDADVVLLLPEDPDRCAADLLAGLRARMASAGDPAPRLGIVLSDTAGRTWRVGQTDFALGAAGLVVMDDLRGSRDSDGHELQVTIRALADEVAAAADLVKGKALGVPVAHVRGLGAWVVTPPDSSSRRGRDAHAEPGAAALIRVGASDWFAFGQAESVRDALGVPPGSDVSAEIGIASTLPEEVDEMAARALRVALRDLPGGAVVSGELNWTGIRLTSTPPDDFVLGFAAARLLVALAGEGLPARLEPLDGLEEPGTSGGSGRVRTGADGIQVLFSY